MYIFTGTTFIDESFYESKRFFSIFSYLIFLNITGKSAVTLPAVDLRLQNRGEGGGFSVFCSYLQYALEVFH